ncbi:hypothetical protein [Prochlorococcus marinus]|uniref:hypothetical protein n=1 Tax=Prochlorococcus marinus TaxID=1219 RepID=UPI0022B36CC7|nr:hypothetical protein [Prochlorococcus marinus]
MLLKRQKIIRSLRHWQQVRSWARLIREAESLWHVEEKEIKRLGALELSQLLEEVPPSYRRRVNLWLIKYSVATRLGGN